MRDRREFGTLGVMLPLTLPSSPVSDPRHIDVRRAPDRYIGVDIARFVAIIGMMAAHLWAPSAGFAESEFARTAAEAAATVTDGTASALFAVLGGVSLVLATTRLREQRGIPGVLLSVLVRGLIVMVLGMLLGLLPNSIIGVLTYFGLSMILAAPFVVAPTAVVAAAAAVLVVFGGWANAAIREAVRLDSFGGALSAVDVVADPAGSLRSALVTGTYPAITWLAYLLVGVLAARVLLVARRRARTAAVGLCLAAGGAVAAFVAVVVSQVVTAQIGTLFHPSGPLGAEELRVLLQYGGFGSAPGTDPWLQLVASPHTGTVGEIVRNVGVALVVVGLCVAWFDRIRPDGSGPSWAARWIQATGAAPLTVYAVHLLVSSATMALAMELGDPNGVPWWALGFWAWCAQVGIALLIGLVLLLLGRRGPLEALLALAIRWAVRLAPLRSSPADAAGGPAGMRH